MSDDRTSPLVDHFYVVQPGADADDTFNRAIQLLYQLHAQLLIITGSEGLGNFDLHNGAVKDAYLTGCAKQAKEALDLVVLLAPIAFTQVKAGEPATAH